MKKKSLCMLISIVFLFLNIISYSKGATPDPIPDDPIITESDIVFTKSSQTLGNTRSQGSSIADVDMDNDLDILFSNYIGACPLWLNNGDGTFTLSDQIFNTQEAHDVALADFNNDSFPDALFICHASPVKLYINNGSGNFTENEQNLGTASGFPQFIDVADVDNDGDNDFLIYYYSAPNRLWLNDGSANFSMVNADIGGDNAKGFEFADFNGDNIPDIFINMRELPNKVLMNDGSGNFIDNGCRLGSGGDATDCIDFDKDGNNDLIISNSGGTTVWLNQNNGESFVSGPTINESALRCGVFDADSDGDFDVVTTNYPNGNKFWLNNGSGSFTSLGQIFGNQQVLSLVCDDIDGDEDVDIVFGQLEGTGGNSIYFNESSIVGIEKKDEGSLNKLNNNYPNPFKRSTKIEFSLSKPSNIILKIYDKDGNNIKNIVKNNLPTGSNHIIWNARNELNRNVCSGIYYYQMISETFTDTKKMIIVD